MPRTPENSFTFSEQSLAAMFLNAADDGESAGAITPLSWLIISSLSNGTTPRSFADDESMI